jgi:hypothetical protein
MEGGAWFQNNIEERLAVHSKRELNVESVFASLSMPRLSPSTSMFSPRSAQRLRLWQRHRFYASQPTILAPPPPSSEATIEINAADSSSTDSASQASSQSPQTHPRANAYSDPPKQSDLPTPPRTIIPAPTPPFSSSNPPFHTHIFFTALEKCFPTPVARALMKATRAMLIDRVGKARRECLGNKDLENVRSHRHLATR